MRAQALQKLCSAVCSPPVNTSVIAASPTAASEGRLCPYVSELLWAFPKQGRLGHRTSPMLSPTRGKGAGRSRRGLSRCGSALWR